MNNRIIGHIKKGVLKGESTFIYYGEYINDLYMYDLYNGMCDFKTTLEKYFLEEEKYDVMFYCKNNIFEAYRILNGEIVEGAEQMFSGKEIANDDSKGMSLDNLDEDVAREKGVDNDTVKSVADNAESVDRTSFQKAIDYCRTNSDKKIAFFFEDYEWTIGLYKSSNDDLLMYVEKLKELSELKNIVTIISIEEVDMLKKYNFKVDGSNVIMLGSPAVEEVYYAYLRKYYKLPFNVNTKYSFANELYDISEAVASGEKSLKEALRIFDRVVASKKADFCKDDFSDALDKVIEEKVFLSDVVLEDDKKDMIRTQVNKFLKAENVSDITKGLILTGPPGTGKTYLVKALANEMSCYFMSPSLADLKAEYVGQTGPKVKRLFQQARANAPTIIFIDEADTVFPSRDGYGDDSDSFSKDMVNQFLVEMDGLTTGNSRVFIVAATNRVNSLDNAIKSRLGKPVEIPLPDKLQRRQLFSNLLIKEGLDFDTTTFRFADSFLDKTNHMSGRDIKNFVDKMRVHTQKMCRAIRDFTDEDEAKELFYKCLEDFEEDLVRKLSDELKITISKCSSGRYSDIIGEDEIKEAITNQVKMFDARERKRAIEYGIKPKKGILLYGSPGNGKSKLAEAAANEHSLYFMKITSDAFTKVSLSEQNRILVKIFNGAFQLSEMCGDNINGVLLFFDEFDSLASSQLLDSRVRGTMLTQLDDEKTLRNPNSKVLFMAATNFYERLDEAMIRAGRIDEKLEMKNPSEENAKKMLMLFTDRAKVIAMNEEESEVAYNRFLKKYKADKINQFFNKNSVQWIIDKKSKDELIETAEKVMEDVRPSAADLKDYAEKLISSAYYSGSFIDGKIRITDEVIEKICG